MTDLTLNDVTPLLLGSTFFGTGGGLPPAVHEPIIRQALADGPLSLQGITDFAPDALLVTAYGVGDPSQATGDEAALIRRGLERFATLVGQPVAGILPGELGVEGLALAASRAAGLPVVDSDLVGGRAAPEIQLDTFTVHSRSVAPVVVLVRDDELILQPPLSAPEVEAEARAFVASRGGSGLLVGYPISASEYAKIGMSGTLSLSLTVGKALMANQGLVLRSLLPGMRLRRDRITRVDLVSDNGFLKGVIHCEEHELLVQNEHLRLVCGDKVVAEAPDLIVLLSEDSVPIHNADVVEYRGKAIQIVTQPAQGYWASERGRALWAPLLKA